LERQIKAGPPTAGSHQRIPAIPRDGGDAFFYPAKKNETLYFTISIGMEGRILGNFGEYCSLVEAFIHFFFRILHLRQLSQMNQYAERKRYG